MLDYYRTLIADAVRTEAYRAALASLVRPEDVVLDLGAGTGLLALLACELGARRAIAIERREAADAAELLAKHLGVADRVTVLHGDSREVAMHERATLLVTETLAMLGLDEGIAGVVADARRRFLAADARVIPHAVRVSFVPLDAPVLHERHVGWWSSQPAGIDLSPLAHFAANAIVPVQLEEAMFLAGPRETIAVDLSAADGAVASGSATLLAARNGTLHGFGGWFTATLAPGVELSNREGTHWSHGFLPLREPIDVAAGETIALTVDAHADGRLWRWRGGIASRATFDQCTAFAAPRCRGHRAAP